jgi:hypothetical protein
MKKTFGMSLLTATVALAAASNAVANQPTLEWFALDDTVVTESCGFPVSVATSGNILRITWVDASGNTRQFEAAPQAKQTFTNLLTSESITINIAGPGHLTLNADGTFQFTATGPWSWFSNPDTDEPGLFLTQGRLVAMLDSAGNFSVTRVGNLVDLCAQLAS